MKPLAVDLFCGLGAALMPFTRPRAKVPGMGAGWRRPDHPDHVPGLAFNTHAERLHKNTGGSWFNIPGPGGVVSGQNPDGRKIPSGTGRRTDVGRGERFTTPGKRDNRKRASALIAKIPLRLSRHIAATYYPARMAATP